MFRKIFEKFSGFVEETRRINRAYREAFANCYVGTPQEVARKTEAWDYVHRITRY
ncbi:hypothetical protein ACFLQN_00930 [Candidatus Aenigmatarchaeota archaeon]